MRRFITASMLTYAISLQKWLLDSTVSLVAFFFKKYTKGFEVQQLVYTNQPILNSHAKFLFKPTNHFFSGKSLWLLLL